MLTELRVCLYMALLFSGMAAASEGSVKQVMQTKYPGVPIQSVAKTPIAGIFEVFANGQVLYTDENVNYLIYIFLYPILGQNSYKKAKAVWCSKNRVRVWDEMMLNGISPETVGTCDTPIEKFLAFGQRQAINGTPTLFFADGQRVTGAVPLKQLKKLLDGAR